MPRKVDQLKAIVKELCEQAVQMGWDARFGASPELASRYERWYGVCLELLKRNFPERVPRFARIYKHSSIWTLLHSGRKPDDFRQSLAMQRGIVESLPEVLDVRALDLTALVTADLLEDELAEARVLLQHGFVRAAGAVAGVALEGHLKLLHKQAAPPLGWKRSDGIGKLANNLSSKGAISLNDSKWALRLGGIRDTCDHRQKQDPSPGEVEELIRDTQRFVQTVRVQ